MFTVHTSYSNYKLRNKLLAAIAFASSHRVVCCGTASRDSFPRFFRRLAGDRLCVIRNGVSRKRSSELPSVSRSNSCARDGFRVTNVARLEPVKNLSVLIDAFARCHDDVMRLTLVGSGELESTLRLQAKKAGVERAISFAGLVPRTQVYDYLEQTDVFVSTSWIEGVPIAVLEAMLCERPVILSDIPAHREIADGTDFIPLVPPDDHEGFSREIDRFRRMTVDRRTAIGASML